MKLDTDSVFVMYRVSTELALEEWYKVFNNMYNAGIAHIILRKDDIFCGYLYSESEYIKMFKGKGIKPLYGIENRIDFDGTAAFLLERQ